MPATVPPGFISDASLRVWWVPAANLTNPATVSVASALNAATSLVLSLVAIHLLARFADRLAPNFGGQSDRLAALRLIAYSSSAALLGGVFAAVPTWAGLGLAPTLYSALILARGIPVLMRSNPERTLSYTAILMIAALALGTINGAILAALR